MNDLFRNENPLDQLSADAPTGAMRSRFDELLERPPRPTMTHAAWAGLAAASIVLVAGFLALTSRSTTPTGLQARDLQILELLEAPSTFDRLLAINAAADLPELSPELSLALLERLEHDDSVNVRLSALGALLDGDMPGAVRDRLLPALVTQETAIVQAHFGYRLLRQQILTKTDLEHILALPETFGDTRDALNPMEES